MPMPREVPALWRASALTQDTDVASAVRACAAALETALAEWDAATPSPMYVFDHAEEIRLVRETALPLSCISEVTVVAVNGHVQTEVRQRSGEVVSFAGDMRGEIEDAMRRWHAHAGARS
jgi:hypothetical protein